MAELYLGNPLLKAAGVQVEWTKETLEEYQRCWEDPQHFIENYIKIVHVDRGLVPFDMYGYQKKMIQTFMDDRFVICKMPRQTGNLPQLSHFFYITYCSTKM